MISNKFTTDWVVVRFSLIRKSRISHIRKIPPNMAAMIWPNMATSWIFQKSWRCLCIFTEKNEDRNRFFIEFNTLHHIFWWIMKRLDLVFSALSLLHHPCGRVYEFLIWDMWPSLDGLLRAVTSERGHGTYTMRLFIDWIGIYFSLLTYMITCSKYSQRERERERKRKRKRERFSHV